MVAMPKTPRIPGPRPNTHQPRDGRFRPFLRGPSSTAPQMREKLQNFTRVARRQQQALIDAAAALLRRDVPVTLAALQAEAPALQAMDLVPTRMAEAANAVREARRPHDWERIAEALQALTFGVIASTTEG